MPIDSPGLVWGALICPREASRATLFLEYGWCKFNEQKNGLSVLTLFGTTLPESACSALRAGKHRLGDLVDCASWKPRFFSSANPIVRTIRNVSRLQWRHAQAYERCAALAITMRDEWSNDYWAYQPAERPYTDVPF